jgi:hypothetical protein
MWPYYDLSRPDPAPALSGYGDQSTVAARVLPSLIQVRVDSLSLSEFIKVRVGVEQPLAVAAWQSQSHAIAPAAASSSPWSRGMRRGGPAGVPPLSARACPDIGAFQLGDEHNFDEFDIASHLAARAGLDGAAHDLPPNAERGNIIPALVKLTLRHSLVTTLADDIGEARETLEGKGRDRPQASEDRNGVLR